MRVHLGSDHAGFEFKALLTEHLRAQGHDVVDHGAHAYDAVDDYPPFCIAAAEAVVTDAGSLGVVIGGSGNGEQIAANKVDGVRAALAWSVQTAQLCREHNDANVIGLGARMHDTATALSIVDTFLSTPFSHDERHVRRIALVSAYETTREA
jgi:ribose 5-phosphate isomerase B